MCRIFQKVCFYSNFRFSKGRSGLIRLVRLQGHTLETYFHSLRILQLQEFFFVILKATVINTVIKSFTILKNVEDKENIFSFLSYQNNHKGPRWDWACSIPVWYYLLHPKSRVHQMMQWPAKGRAPYELWMYKLVPHREQPTFWLAQSSAGSRALKSGLRRLWLEQVR